MSNSYFSLAFGIGTVDSSDQLLEVYYPAPAFQPNADAVNKIMATLNLGSGNHALVIDQAQLDTLFDACEEQDANDTGGLQLLQSIGINSDAARKRLVLCVLTTDKAPTTVAEAYLKLQLISLRHCKPHSIDLSGVFALLPNNAWTNEGAIALEELTMRQTQARADGRALTVDSVDKFPKMTDYVVPSGVRIADTRRVRLGAYLGEGTTVMHEGFVNFNAGTEGPGMIEGRISAGVFVGKGSDLGGGCSTMGTLSGGNSVVISIGEECLIGANAGLGFPLGDRCTIEAGLYITAGSIVTLLDDHSNPVSNCKARDLSGKSDLLFRRNSLTGMIECKTNRSAIALNEELHANN